MKPFVINADVTYICDAVSEGRCNGRMRSYSDPCTHGSPHRAGGSCMSAGCGKIGRTVVCIPIKREPDWEV